jgi:hypothetical protein
VETWFKLGQVRESLGDAAGAAEAMQAYQALKAGQAPTRGEDA